MEKRVQSKLGVKVGAESRQAYNSVEGGLSKGRSESSLERVRPAKGKFLTYQKQAELKEQEKQQRIAKMNQMKQ
jgi:hypothetical protein